MLHEAARCSWVSRGWGQRKLLLGVTSFRSQQCHFGFLKDSETINSGEILDLTICPRILILRAFSSIIYHQPHPRISRDPLPLVYPSSQLLKYRLPRTGVCFGPQPFPWFLIVTLPAVTCLSPGMRTKPELARNLIWSFCPCRPCPACIAHSCSFNPHLPSPPRHSEVILPVQLGLRTLWVSNSHENLIQHPPRELRIPGQHSPPPQLPKAQPDRYQHQGLGLGSERESDLSRHPIVSSLRDMDNRQFGVKICHSDFFYI